jgi:chromosome segregation ATPase
MSTSAQRLTAEFEAVSKALEICQAARDTAQAEVERLRAENQTLTEKVVAKHNVDAMSLLERDRLAKLEAENAAWRKLADDRAVEIDGLISGHKTLTAENAELRTTVAKQESLHRWMVDSQNDLDEKLAALDTQLAWFVQAWPLATAALNGGQLAKDTLQKWREQNPPSKGTP